MTTLSGLVAETKRHLLSSQREVKNKLAAAVTDSAETFTLTYDTAQIQVGHYLEIDLEVLYVWAVDQSTKTVTVGRAQQGSVAATHAEGAVVTVNPKFPDFAIVKAINDDLADLSAQGLYAVRTVSLTAAANAAGYDLTGASDLLEVLSVTTKWPGADRHWTPVTNYELARNAHSDFASGYALTVSDDVQVGYPIRVTYKASFTAMTALTDDVEGVAGLPVTMHDLPPMGAAVRLVAPREIRRNFYESQGDSRRAEEVPPGAVGSSMRPLAALRAGRIENEKARLAQQWPDRGFVPTPTAWW